AVEVVVGDPGATPLPVEVDDDLPRAIGPVLEVGPGKVLAGLLKRIDGSRSARTVGTAEELERSFAGETA
ncbi:MAG: hypothetical protein NTW97_09220, partial [Candidatus Krumholzibacteria bacterium]|nr:hypothetical protein [Candidatus Krumholzibacteria bacterium]